MNVKRGVFTLTLKFCQRHKMFSYDTVGMIIVEFPSIVTSVWSLKVSQ